MFETVLIESSGGSPHRTSLWPKGLSFTTEALLISLAIVAPLLHTEELPDFGGGGVGVVELSAPLAAASLGEPSIVTHLPTHSELNDEQLLTPSRIPRHVQEIHEEVAENTTFGGDVMGVVGSVPSLAGTRTIASLFHNLSGFGEIVPPHAVRLSSGVAEGLLIHEVRPAYPSQARRAGIQGTVVLLATIGKDGTIQNLRLLSGHPLLSEAAIRAVRQWRYRPYLLNKEAVDVDTTIQVKFTLTTAT